MGKPFVLIILDGWGLAPPGPGNAISQAKLTHIPRLWANFPHTQLSASEQAVGLPAGEDGNTETGHINIGAGRVVYQDLPRINMSIKDGSFYTNDAFLGAIRYSKAHGSNIHLMGLLSDSGVHASREHLYALLELMKQNQCSCPVYLHLFTDGRDSPPKSGIRFIHEVEAKLAEYHNVNIATVMGRYYAMDRDRRWDRTARAYQALTEDIPSKAKSAAEAVEASYAKNITDEFIEPVIITDDKGVSLPRINTHDSVIFYNYRIDRPRQLTRAFTLENFETYIPKDSFDPYAVKYYHKHVVEDDFRQQPFVRTIKLSELFFVTMTEYERPSSSVVAYPLQQVEKTLGQVFSEGGLRQLRVSETEKERFVGYYFNGMREVPFSQEDRLIVPSPRVPTYDLQPGMSATELTNHVLDRMTSNVYSFILINFANPDMVGHTGNIPAAIKACEITDECVGRITSLALAMGGSCMVTADHGNVEEMVGPSGEMDTEHSMFPVPAIMIDKRYENQSLKLPLGKLADIAPTILAMLGLPVPAEMTGKNLLADT
ncbi:2,3-bisphosphoglycerate-independent phosphoglycerate mutase [Candidatus Gottesmanbacteria bacterium]|nr:2,3-bisphosphoglycerate-independent phosphoglycerate mutase [Candidatus Gottesmanbacteria bacterium]